MYMIRFIQLYCEFRGEDFRVRDAVVSAWHFTKAGL